MKVYSLDKDIENEELPPFIEGIVRQYLARECNQVTRITCISIAESRYRLFC